MTDMKVASTMLIWVRHLGQKPQSLQKPFAIIPLPHINPSFTNFSLHRMSDAHMPLFHYTLHFTCGTPFARQAVAFHDSIPTVLILI